MTLDPIQLRTLGALIEKEITTPENYPLSLNSLISACNQRSSRDPVLDLTEDEVRQAVHSLEDLDLVAPVRDARVPKYEHRIRTVLNLRRDETAVLCLLLLRGPQTPGELRGRADRMYSFDDIGAVQATLERLASRGADEANTGAAHNPASQPLVVMLPRQPGSRESRFAHLLGGPVTPLETSRSTGGTFDQTARESRRVTERGHPVGELPSSIQAELLARVETLETALNALQLRVEALEPVEDTSGRSLEPPAPRL